jgi:serine/threonine protein kinase
MHIRCPHCHNPIEVIEDSGFTDVVCPSCGSSFNLLGHDETQSYRPVTRAIAHFELIEQLGIGHFGAVWKAKDTKLDRFVAIKIPRKEQLSESEAELFLRDARAAAQLKHPNIVSVFEVGTRSQSSTKGSDWTVATDLMYSWKINSSSN